jgi:hypothetical protein
MPWIRRLLALGMLAAIVAAGCATTQERIRPPKPPEEFNPPPDDPRYTGPVQYPPEALEQDALLKRTRDKDKGPGGPIGRPGAPGAGSIGRMPGT